MESLLIRCSALGKIMTSSSLGGLTKKQEETIKKLSEKDNITDKQKEELDRLIYKKENAPMFDLSTGAMTYIKEIVKRKVYNYEVDIWSKEMEKGNYCEDESIDLYNQINFTEYAKNTIKVFGDYLSGTCDIHGKGVIVDIKTSWSKATFPALAEDGVNSDYEWQLRGYMMLYNEQKAELAYMLIDTPDHLLEYEKNFSLHHMDNVPLELRKTSLFFDRDLEKEQEIKYKVNECRKFAVWYMQQITAK